MARKQAELARKQKEAEAAKRKAEEQRNEEDRKALVEKAVLKELRYMNYLLNDKQYRTYVMLLNTTLNNRGLNK